MFPGLSEFPDALIRVLGKIPEVLFGARLRIDQQNLRLQQASMLIGKLQVIRNEKLHELLDTIGPGFTVPVLFIATDNTPMNIHFIAL